jgi:hypothetical protein
MNSYFKTADEVAGLFQQLFHTLHLEGFEVARDLYNEAFRHDPYNLTAHYTCAIYFAGIKNFNGFFYHLQQCGQHDNSYKEKLLTDPVIVNAFSPEQMVQLKAVHIDSDLPMIFYAVDPPGDVVYIKFKSGHQQEISSFYQTLPQQLYANLQQISVDVEDVRFFIITPPMDYIDEVIICEGTFYSYRHQAGEIPTIGTRGSDDHYVHLDFFHSLAEDNPDDTALKAWLLFFSKI